MTIQFSSSDLHHVLAEAIANDCRVILVKDHGVYFMSERGERRPDGHRKRIAYALGCNPYVDDFDAWWPLANAECGGDDFGECLDPRAGIFTLILRGGHDLTMSFSATHFSLHAVKAAE